LLRAAFFPGARAGLILRVLPAELFLGQLYLLHLFGLDLFLLHFFLLYLFLFHDWPLQTLPRQSLFFLGRPIEELLGFLVLAPGLQQLVKGVREMKRHVAGKTVRGAKTAELSAPSVRSIREAAQISQSQFAKLIGVNLRTLQNWEQERTKPTGPARALLKIVASDPKALEALHG